MIKVHINSKEIIITGHANYDYYGKDIVCASASSIVATSVNAALRFDENFLEYNEETDKFTIKIKGDNKNCLLIIENMISMLEDLASTYKTNVKIIKEEKL